MNNEIATRSEAPRTALAIADDQTQFTPAQVAALRQLGVDGATDGDLAIYFHQAKRTGLDPFARQIYMVGRWSREGTKFTIQTGIDGYRLIAARTGLHMGTDDAVFEHGPNGRPIKATVTVWKLVAGTRVAFTASARWEEYAQTNRNGEPTQMWQRMSHTMLAKCAEALALRKAFPQDLSGIYTAEEMAQADTGAAPVPSIAPAVAAAAERQVPVNNVKAKAKAEIAGDRALTDTEKDVLARIWAEQNLPAAGSVSVTAATAFVEAAKAEAAALAELNAGEVVDGEVVEEPPAPAGQAAAPVAATADAEYPF